MDLPVQLSAGLAWCCEPLLVKDLDPNSTSGPRTPVELSPTVVHDSR
jgi:hypothetical protein